MPPTTYSLFVQNLREGRSPDYATVQNLAAREAPLWGELLSRATSQAMVKNDPHTWRLFGRTSGTTSRRNPADPVEFNRNALSLSAKACLRMTITPLPMIEYEHDILDAADENHWNTMAAQEEADQSTDHLNFCDDDILAEPDADMETFTDQRSPPFSLITLICPDGSDSTGFPVTTGVPGNFGATTTVQNLDPDDVPTVQNNNRWAPKGEYYGGDPFDPDDGVCEKLGRLFDRLRFTSLIGSAGNTHSQSLNPESECMIITGYNGSSVLRRNQFRNNDNHGNDSSFQNPSYRGLKLNIVSGWDQKNYDYRGGSPYTSAFAADEPLFLCVNKRDVFVIGHEQHFYRHVTKDMGARQYDVDCDILETWWNLKARRRDTSGFVAAR